MKLRAREIRFDARRLDSAIGLRPMFIQGQFELPARLGNFAQRGAIFRAQTAGAAGKDVADHPNPMADMIEHNQTEIEHHDGIVCADVVFGVIGDAFEQPHHVIREVSNRSRHQGRQPGYAHRPVALNAIAQEVQGIGLHPRDAAFGFENAGSVDVPKHFGGMGADEGVARDLLTALDALEQAGVACVPRQAQVGPYGRKQVGRKGIVDGDEIAFAGQAGKRTKVGLYHRKFVMENCQAEFVTGAWISLPSATPPEPLGA